MPIASGLTTDTSNTHSSTARTAPDYALPGFGAQTITVALVGVVGALFVFAAFNTLNRTATAKVRKR